MSAGISWGGLFYLFILVVNPILEKRKREKNPKSKIQLLTRVINKKRKCFENPNPNYF